MNTRAARKLINDPGRISALNEILDSLEAGLESDKLDALFVCIESAANLLQMYLNFFNGLKIYANAQFSILFKDQAGFKKCQRRFSIVVEKIEKKKAEREKPGYIKKSFIDDKEIEQRKEKLNKHEAEIISLLKKDIEILLKDNLFINPLSELVKAEFFSGEIPEVQIYADGIDKLSKLKTKRMIQAYILKVGNWASPHMGSFKKLQPFNAFLLVLSDISCKSRALLNRIIDQGGVGEFFKLINQIINPKVEVTNPEMAKLKAVFKVAAVIWNLDSYRDKLLADKGALHAVHIDSAKAWLLVKPAEEIRKKYIEYILKLEEIAEDLPENQDVDKLLTELRTQYKRRYPDKELPIVKKTKIEEDGSDPTASPRKRKERIPAARLADYTRHIGYATEWLKKKPEDELKALHSSHISKIEFVSLDEPDNADVTRLLEELKAKFKEYYSEELLPSVVPRPRLVKEHTRQRTGNSLFNPGDRQLLLLPVKPLILPPKDEQKEDVEEQTPKAPRARASSKPPMKKQNSTPRLFSTILSPRKSLVLSPRKDKSSPRKAASPRDEKRDEKKELKDSHPKLKKSHSKEQQ